MQIDITDNRGLRSICRRRVQHYPNYCLISGGLREKACNEKSVIIQRSCRRVGPCRKGLAGS